MNTVKILISVALLGAGVAAFYYLPQWLGTDVPGFARGGVVVVAAVLGFGLFLVTDQGRALLEFFKGSRAEVRKMFWPTRRETMQSTGMVIVMVILIGLLLWAFDRVVFYAIYDWILGID